MARENELDLLQESLNKLKKQIDAMREREKYEEEKKEYKEVLQGEFKDQFETLQNNLVHILKNKLNEKDYTGEKSVRAISTIITACNFKKSWNTISTSVIYNSDDINEDGLAAALEPFTNPKRILLLKKLIYKPLSASEISQQTGLVGGQLYHHLSILENSGFIEKSDDKYHLKDETLNFLVSLFTVCGGMNIAKP